MERYDGDSPINARIKIDYSKDKPKVSFAYPRKKSQFKGSMWTVIFVSWLILNLPLLMYVSFILNDSQQTEMKRPYNSLSEYNKNNYTSFLEYYTQKERIDYYYDYYNKPFINSLKDSFIESLNVYPLSLSIWMFGGWTLFYFPFKKKWDKLFPDYQALTSSKKIAKFRKEDVKDNLEKNIKYPYYVELTVFNNVVCDFNATDDFSKYMKEFEIKEHKFVFYKKKKVKIGKKKRKEHKVNEWLWYARWYFSDKPIKGNLEVLFK